MHVCGHGNGYVLDDGGRSVGCNFVHSDRCVSSFGNFGVNTFAYVMSKIL